MIIECDLLNDEECSRVAAQVHACREHWSPMLSDLPFFMLGAAAYVDARGQHQDCYQRKADRLSPLLQQHFGWVHERLVHRLGTVLEQPVQYHPRYGRPGFHIWQYHPKLLDHRPLPHIDDPLLFLDWDRAGPLTFDDQTSITLPIRLPTGGAGLNWWDLAPHQVHGKPREELRSLITPANRNFQPYTPGRVYVHSRPALHQVNLGADWRPGDERITLQCFAVSVRGVWQLFF